MELIQNRERRLVNGGSGVFDEAQESGRSNAVTVISGPYMQSLPVAGMTVGQIRARFGGILDIAPRSIAVINGQDVSDEVVVTENSCLTFVSRAGEKGNITLRPSSPRAGGRTGARRARDEISLYDDRIAVTTPEGVRAEMPLAELLDVIRQREDPFRDVCWADGVRHVFVEWPMAVVVLELPPAVHRVQWISRNSPVPYGKGCLYDMRTLAMPYLIFFATYAWHPGVTGDEQPGGLRLTQRCEVFMRRAPLKSLNGLDGLDGLDGEVLLPALLNSSKYKSSDGRFDVPGKNISWLCNQHQPITPFDQYPINERMRRSLAALVDYLLHSGFNYSGGETNPAAYAEECSWYQYTVRHNSDERIATVERWEEETAKDPMFILDVPFVQSGFSVRQVGERILREFNVPMPKISSAADVARLTLNYSPEGRVRKIVYPHAMWPTST